MTARSRLALLLLLAGGSGAFAQAPLQTAGPLGVVEATTGGPGFTVYGRAEYLMWWARGNPLPPVLSTSPPGTPRATAGVPGTDGYQVLFGDSRVDNDLQHGARLLAGFKGGDTLPVGAEIDFFFLGGDSANEDARSSGNVVLARPFTNVQTNQPAASLVAFPGESSGSFALQTSTSLLGTGLPVREPIYVGSGLTVEALGGFRYLRLKEKLNIRTHTLALDGATDTTPGTTRLVEDFFTTSTQFYGADFGLVTTWQEGPFGVELTGRLAAGSNRRTVDITGRTTTTPPGQTAGVGVAAPAPGGLLALPTNIGGFDHSAFSLVPELTVRLTYEVSDRFTVFAGYNLLYWTQVVRPGDQVDLTVNPSQIPPGTLNGAARPRFSREASDFWAQGITLGLEARY